MAASKVTPEAINHMILHGRGLICVPLLPNQLGRLGISSMVPHNREAQKTDFTVSVDAADGITTGISAFDRASTIEILASPSATPESLVQPGHVFPLRARPGGVLERAGHTEAAVDLASLAGLHPSGVICEILKKDGTMARLPDLTKLKKKWGMKMLSIASLIEFRHKREKLVKEMSVKEFSHHLGKFRLHTFMSVLDDRIHYGLSYGKWTKAKTPMVRVQAANVVTDVLGYSASGVSRNTIDDSLRAIVSHGCGALLYLEPRRNDSDTNEPKSPSSEKHSQVPPIMDFRDYGIGAQVLSALGISKLVLLSRDRRRVIGLEGYGLEIVKRVTLPS
jgi:3,4-dihydroxy 2-butanone 4-phosphate synthase/GTP cyclohydrolase II